jgi:hypothetical protein
MCACIWYNGRTENRSSVVEAIGTQDSGDSIEHPIGVHDEEQVQYPVVVSVSLSVHSGQIPFGHAVFSGPTLVH